MGLKGDCIEEIFKRGSAISGMGSFFHISWEYRLSGVWCICKPDGAGGKAGMG